MKFMLFFFFLEIHSFGKFQIFHENKHCQGLLKYITFDLNDFKPGIIANSVLEIPWTKNPSIQSTEMNVGFFTCQRELTVIIITTSR